MTATRDAGGRGSGAAGNAVATESAGGIPRAELAAAAGAAMLFGSLFLGWYAYEMPRPGDSAAASAWEVFSATDVLLTVLAGLVLMLVALGVVRRNVPIVHLLSSVIMALAGIAALALVAARLVLPPGDPAFLGFVGITIDATRLGGVFVALAAALLMAAGGVVAASGVVLDAVSRAFERLSRE